eukprot:2147-Heterococcus_DN1.PRE.1
MRQNWELALAGPRLTLIPYRKRHVAKYHAWMSDSWIRKVTASEPLSLEEEYSMQVEWREDSQKCTFIVLRSSDPDHSSTDAANATAAAATSSEGDTNAALNAYDDTHLMIGDVNLFFGGDYDNPKAAEVEVSSVICNRFQP